MSEFVKPINLRTCHLVELIENKIDEDCKKIYRKKLLPGEVKRDIDVLGNTIEYIEQDVTVDTIPEELSQYLYEDKAVPNLLADYDVLGFVAENCLVKFNQRELYRIVIKAHIT